MLSQMGKGLGSQLDRDKLVLQGWSRFYTKRDNATVRRKIFRTTSFVIGGTQVKSVTKVTFFSFGTPRCPHFSGHAGGYSIFQER